MNILSRLGAMTNRLVRPLGIRIVRASQPHGSGDGLGVSRVTTQGMTKAIARAHDLFPDRKVVAFVDADVDATGTPFGQTLEIPCELITGDPEKDLVAHEIARTAFVFGLNSDEKVIAYLDYVTQRDGKYFCSYDIQNARWWHLRDAANAVLLAEKADCRRNNHTHFAPDQLANLMQSIDITRACEGDYVEIGVFKGTSARLAYHYMKATHMKRRCFFLDTFAGFDYGKAKASSDAHWQGTHLASLDKVVARLNAVPTYGDPEPTFKVVKSNIVENELPDAISSIALCNIDVDIYDAILAALRKTWPLLVDRGICVVQDPGRTPLLGGARLALECFVRELGGQECHRVYMESGQTLLIKG